MPASFRTPVMKTYPLPERLALCDALGDVIDEVLLSAMPTPEQSGSGERMMLARWAHAHTTYGAVLELAREPMPDGQSVGMLSRPLFEAMIDTYWIAANGLKAQDLAVKQMTLLRVSVAEHYNAWRLPGDPEMPVAPADLAERPGLAKLFGSRAQKHWTRLDLWSRMQAVNRNVPQERTGELEDRYHEDNHLANLLLHGSPMAMNDRLVNTARGVTLQLGPSKQHLANGMRHAYWSYQRLGLLMIERLQPGRVGDLTSTYHHGWARLQTISKGALKAAGRNGPCPCGSGAKSKDCHGAL
jgi:hypothetical protein